MKKEISFIAVILLIISSMITGCSSSGSQQNAVTYTQDSINPNEEYVLVTTAVSLPIYVNHDEAAFKRWGKIMGVRTSILGPSDWNVPAQISTIEQVIGTHPAGLLINGTDPALAEVINKAVDAGIPTVVYDSDIPGSKRDAFLGSDWYEIGKLQGEEVVKLTHGQGKVACLGILGMTNQESGFRGLQDVLKQHPGIQFIGKYDAHNMEEAAKVASDLIRAHPDLSALCAFTSETGPGIALAVKEADKVGSIKITAVDWEPQLLQLVKKGIIQYLVGQKRELFTWYGAQFLFDLVHQTNRLTSNDKKAGIVPVPNIVKTGLIQIDAKNVDKFIKKKP
jgi:ABC-type sugar transport system substrate-binding protein